MFKSIDKYNGQNGIFHDICGAGFFFFLNSNVVSSRVKKLMFNNHRH